MAEPIQFTVPTQRTARLAGALYLGTIVAGLYAEIGSRSALIVSRDAAATAHNIAANPALFRAGLVADIVMLACYIGVTALLHDMFRVVSRQLSATAALFSLIGIAVLAADGFFALLPLQVLGASNWLGAIPIAQREALALLSLRLHGDGYDLSLVFFGVYCVLIGWLAWRSGFLPKWVGGLMILAGICYLFNSLADLAAPAFASTLSPHLKDPELIGEAALALWLLIFGVRKSGHLVAASNAR